MAKRAYIGVGGKAKRIKKGYIGIGGKARKIKKAYIGIGGKARPCWAGDTLSYYGSITPLSITRDSCASDSNGTYALICGGNAADAYDASLTRTTPTAPSASVWDGTLVYNGKYLVLSHGQSSGTISGTVEAYSDTLTKVSAASLHVPRRTSNTTGTAIGGYAIFAGGYHNGYKCEASAYSQDLTRSAPAPLMANLYSAAGASTAHYAIFAGGENGSGASSSVTAYNASLTRSSATALSVARTNHMGAGKSSLAMFFGGFGSNTVYSTVDTYTDALVRSTATNLSVSRRYLSCICLDQYTLVCGGESANSVPYSTTDVYDKDLVRTSGEPLCSARSSLDAAIVGDYALFTGGGGSYSTNVDVFTLI